MTDSIRWDARHILRQIADADLRRDVLSSFWRHGDLQSRAMAIAQLAKALHFREETIRKMPPAKKADLLATRLTAPEFEQVLEMALMQYHTHDRNEMLGAFLDHWKVPHQNGSIEEEEYAAPNSDQVRDAVNTLTQYPKRSAALYLASAGLLMGGDWREATWPVVDELVATL
jgi:hypothetical protein